MAITTKTIFFSYHYLLGLTVIVLLCMCYFTDKLVIFRVFIHHCSFFFIMGDLPKNSIIYLIFYNENHLLLHYYHPYLFIRNLLPKHHYCICLEHSNFL